MRGAIFDVDGTLLDSMQVWWDVVVDFFKEHGVELPYEEAKEYKEMTMNESIPTIKNRLNLDLSFEELSNTFMHMGLKQYETTVPLKKGADKYLKKLHNSGIKIAIATSGYEELCKTAFTRLGVWNYIDACAFSSEVGVNKSNPDVYLLAAKRIGIPPEECTVLRVILFFPTYNFQKKQSALSDCCLLRFCMACGISYADKKAEMHQSKVQSLPTKFHIRLRVYKMHQKSQSIRLFRQRF